ncbi:hypothetical protein E8K88_12870 [Lampropedia aestuarii]|uniref:Uncharacterized protein n=1 Tax=Lampropedia aestuarii TaxID=2562762 RepID=A0A4S5BQN8_9BURK|nr:hypothetical protein [Lampropedia aestuarii]THJ32138.1 hypothetical protein E8K88_12870 [Lampropedia aestuarii]
MPDHPPFSATPGVLSRRQTVLALSAAALAPLLLSACQSKSEPDANQSTPQAAAKPDPLAIDWEALNQAVGQYPANSPFLAQPAIVERLTKLLGQANYAQAQLNLQVASPLSVEGSVFYITGNRAHEGGINAVAIGLDEASNTIRVWLLQNSQAHVFAEPGANFAWPRDVQTMIGNSQS